MTELEIYTFNLLKQLIPNAECFDFRANIGDKTCSIEFFVTIGGKKTQCYDMIDAGIIEEKDFDYVARQLANHIRTSSDYRPGEINKFSFTAEI